MRVLLFTGEGGVGKTTVAAATALRCAAGQRRTLILSVGGSETLTEAFARPVGPAPTMVAERVWAQRVDPAQEAAHWQPIAVWLRDLLAWVEIAPEAAGAAVMLPGAAALLALPALLTHAGSGRWDVLVVDGPPVAEMIALLAVSDVLQIWTQRPPTVAAPLSRLTRPLVERLVDVPLPNAAARDALRDLAAQVQDARALLADPGRASVRLVLTPSRMGVAAARRGLTALALYGCPAQLVVCNRVIPAQVTDPYLAAWKEAQAEQMADLQTAIAPVPLRSAPLLEHEAVGISDLVRLGDALWGADNPSADVYHPPAPALRLHDGEYLLSLPLPLVRPAVVSLSQTSDILTVRVGPTQRALLLPPPLRRLTCAAAQLSGGMLTLRFPDVGAASGAAPP